MKKSLISLTGVAVLGVFGLLPVSEALADHPAGSGGKFTVHINRDISGFDHIKVPQGGMGRYQVLYAVHDKLFSKDANGKTVSRLATKATHSDDFKNWRVKSPKLDAAIKAIQAAGNDAELKKANCAFAKAKTEVVPYLPFEYAIAAIIHQKNIGGLTVPNDTVLGYHHIFRKK